MSRKAVGGLARRLIVHIPQGIRLLVNGEPA